jgi:four helix bundle protein
MNADELKQRTKKFSLEIIKLIEILPKTKTGDVIGRQILRSGTSIGANYRSACRTRSKADFISKTGIAIEEADETIYWLELLLEASLIPEQRLKDVMKEANELTAILTASVITAKKNLQKLQQK